MINRRLCIAAILIFGAVPLAPLMGGERHPGQEVYEKVKCRVCHGEDGSGDTHAGKSLGARDLRSKEVQKLSNEQIAGVIRDGQNKMPAFGKALSAEEIRKLVSLIRSIAAE